MATTLMSNNNGNATLYANMAKVMGVLKTIPKNGRNKQQGYGFVTDSDLLDAIRPALAKHNIALVADMIEVASGERPTKVLMRFRLCCGETGAVVESRWWGQSNMPGDKALTAAAVLAQKYFLKATFAISTGDESDDPDAPRPAKASRKQRPVRKAMQTAHETRDAPGRPDALKDAYTKAHGLFPGMDWSMFGAQIMQPGDGDEKRLRGLPASCCWAYPDGKQISDIQAQQEVIHHVRSDMHVMKGVNGDATDSDSTGQAWQAASAEVAAIQQQEAGPVEAAAAAGRAGRVDARWLARYSEGDEWLTTR